MATYPTLIPEAPYCNIGNETARWDDGWFYDTVYARRFVAEIFSVDTLTVNDLEVTNNITTVNLTANGTIAGPNVTSGADPGHTHTIYLKADGTVPLTGDWTTGIFSIIGSDHWYLRADWVGLYFGVANDAVIYYDGTDMIIDPQAVGTGQLKVEGSIKINDYLGIGNESGSASTRFNCVFPSVDTSGPQRGIRVVGLYGNVGSGNMTYPVYGVSCDFGTSSAWNGNSSSSFEGGRFATTHRGSGTVVAMIGGTFTSVLAATATGNVATMYGGYFGITDQAPGASVANAYGMYVDNINSGTSINYAIYTGLGDVRFGDDLILAEHLHLVDNKKVYFGAADDASIYYNATHLIVNSQEVGAGSVWFPGTTGIGIGTEPGGLHQFLNIIYHPVLTATACHGIRLIMLYGDVGSGNSGVRHYAVYMDGGTAATYNNNPTSLYGAYFGVTHRGSGTLAETCGFMADVILASTGNITTARVLCVVCEDNGAGSFTNVYGLHIGDITQGSTFNYSIYTNAGQVRIGGDQFFEGAGSGLPYGEIFCYDVNDTITIAGTGIANKVQVTSFDTDGVSNLMTPDHTNDHITIVKTGVYLVTVSTHVESEGGTAYVMGLIVCKNNGATLFTNLHAHRALSGGGGDTGSISISGLASLTAADTIEVWCYNDTNTNDIIIADMTLSIVMVGG